jgi:hypothetical protein
MLVPHAVEVFVRCRKELKMKKVKVKAKRILDKINQINCNSIESIEDITDQKKYIDEVAKGKNDGNLVSCGQDDSYNELQYIYDTILLNHIESKRISKKDALNALCLCCAELKFPRKRKDYYSCLEEKLGIKFD